MRPCASCTVATPSSPSASTIVALRDRCSGRQRSCTTSPPKSAHAASAYTSARNYRAAERRRSLVADRGTACRNQSRRHDRSAGGPVLRDAARRSRRRRHQGGAAGSRRSGAGLGAAVSRGRERLFSRRQSQQAQHRARYQGPGRSAAAAAAHRPRRRLSHQQSAPRLSRALRGSIPRRCAAPIRGSCMRRISGYGHTGPKANRGGYDIIAQGEAGLMALTGPPEGGPSRFPSPMADISGGHLYVPRRARGAVRARPAPAARGAASSSTSRSSTPRRAGSRTSARAISRRASGRRGSATRIRTSRRISRCARATRR